MWEREWEWAKANGGDLEALRRRYEEEAQKELANAPTTAPRNTGLSIEDIRRKTEGNKVMQDDLFPDKRSRKGVGDELPDIEGLKGGPRPAGRPNWRP
jgi:hypothetical protein